MDRPIAMKLALTLCALLLCVGCGGVNQSSQNTSPLKHRSKDHGNLWRFLRLILRHPHLFD